MHHRITYLNERFLKFFAITGTLSLEESGRRRLFAIFLFLLVIPLLIFGIHVTRKGLYRYGILDVFLAFVFMFFIFMLRRVKNPRLMYRVVLVMLYLLLTYWINTGAIKGFATIWILTFPPFGFYLMGKREGFLWTLLISATAVIHFYVPVLSLTGFVYEKDFSSRLLFAMFLITLFTYNYESTREKYQTTTESDQQKLKEQQAHLEELVTERTLHLQEKMNELEASEKRYRLFSDNITDLIWSLDGNLEFTYISPSVTIMYGYTVDEAMHLPHERWNTPASYSRLMARLDEQRALKPSNINADQNTVVMQLDHIKKDGSVFPVELKATVLRDSDNTITGYTGISRDITDRIKVEEEKDKIREQLVQAQKMEAVGTLAGGLAHDFNNFLGGIIGSFELISRFLDRKDADAREMIVKYLGIGLDSAKKSSNLIKQLLALSRKHELHLEPIEINRSLEHVVELCKNSLPKSVQIEYMALNEPLYIMGEPAQMEQVLLNLCINASHAMTILRQPGEKQGGTLGIMAECISSDHVIRSYYTELTDTGTWARIRITDTGVGMDNETKKRIFEPFYSTKQKSDGTGLGLAISYNIIQKHGGIINVYSEPGTGSCFTIYIPVFDDQLLTLHPDEVKTIEKGTGTILVIDDEIFILNIARGLLEQCGYNVITAEGASEGIESYRSNMSGITAIIIDYSMPGKDGLEVFREIKKVNSGVKAMLSSGMLDSRTRELALESGIADTVNKPYTLAELSVKVKRLVLNLQS